MAIIMNKTTTARIYRFQDHVAIHLGEGKTHYLTPQEAQDICLALKECETDINRQSNFAKSGFITREIGIAGK